MLLPVFIFSLIMNLSARGCPSYGIPERLIVEAACENGQLEEERLVLAEINMPNMLFDPIGVCTTRLSIL